MNIIVAPADPKDVRGMHEVRFNTWLATYPNKELGITEDDVRYQLRDLFTEEGLEKTAGRLRNPAAGEAMFFAKDGDRVIGFCGIKESEEENRLSSIYVLPEYQGKGIGKKLWQTVAPLFNPEKDTFVRVASYNMQAIDFYKRLGFTDTGRRWLDEKYRLKSGAIIPEMELVLRKA